MGKVFTITEGLENMGALKTGGQGSVYKGRRNGTTITAVKLLPTPISSESKEDKNYIDFQNEVEKLRRVNQTHNPHIVTILNSGITETGSFPFIEMEFIEGPDLEELLKPPHEPVFTINETTKVAKHIATALAHCHDVEVKHGDMKTNNIKLNSKTGNYVLLDFGLATMSDEQRRTSLRHAGAIEFMAPEQNEGQLLFQSDVYSFGIIIYELLTGKVPFPLTDKSETSRNQVMLSHIETDPPDIPEMRSKHIPASWPTQKIHEELNIPAWIINMIMKCLEKDPAKRFASGKELYQYIKEESNKSIVRAATQMVNPTPRVATQASAPTSPPPLRSRVELNTERRSANTKKKRPAMIFFLVAIMALGGFAAYRYLGNNSKVNTEDGLAGVPRSYIDTTGFGVNNDEAKESKSVKDKKQPERVARDTFQIQEDTLVNIINGDTVETIEKKEEIPHPSAPSPTGTKYKVRSKAFFHNEPDEATRREAFIVHWNNAVLIPKEEKNGFVYVVFTNHLGQTSKGWLRLQDLVKSEE